ncbi:MAG: 3-deoxy-7-phosphoheptulonate synthase [Sphingomonadaceae bacterium]
MIRWRPDSWREHEARQQPRYADRDALAKTLARLRTKPPLVGIGAIDRLRTLLAAAARGEAFVFQAGECAEPIDAYDAARTRRDIALIGRLAARLAEDLGTPAIRIGRIAGQYAKPRSHDIERRGGLMLPAYRGDAVNGFAFDSRLRRPDPARLLAAYESAAATLAIIRRDAAPPFFASHEALLLRYEQALIRRDPTSGRAYAGSGHFLWIGERTLFERSAHVELLRGLANPVGLKCGPRLEADTLRRILARLDPHRAPGRIVLIVRLGRKRIAERLPALLAAVRAAGHEALWMCDPMHGNAGRDANGRKSRNLADMAAEIEAFVSLMRAHGAIAAGLHLELTADPVSECAEGPGACAPLSPFSSLCDPRLNAAQAERIVALLGARETAPARASAAA